MWLQSIELREFRAYQHLELSFPQGLTVVTGPNGWGKTNLVEAVSYLSTLDSFRGAPSDVLVRHGASTAVIRGSLEQENTRKVTIEAEVGRGRNRVLLNGQRSKRSDTLEAFRTTVFSPDDLDLVKGGPAERRSLLDLAVVMSDSRAEPLRAELDRVLRQRAALLKSLNGRLDPDGAFTLDVWDQRLSDVGQRWGIARYQLVGAIGPLVAEAYRRVSGSDHEVHLRYEAPWMQTGLAAALLARRDDEVRRGVCLVGPHRDDLCLELNGHPARTHASQGEQRSVAIALRISIHQHLAKLRGTAPLLILDDVLSELDPARRQGLLECLPPGQSLLTTAGDLPADVEPAQVLHMTGVGTIEVHA